MISLNSRTRIPPADTVKLPSYCIPARESNDLIAKREAQLKWMRENGLRYLGDPQRLARQTPEPRRQPAAVRLIRSERLGPATAAIREIEEPDALEA